MQHNVDGYRLANATLRACHRDNRRRYGRGRCQTVPVDIVLQTVSTGISGFVIELSVQNAVIAQILSVTLPGYGLVVVTGTPGPTALVIVADANEILQGQITSVVIATANINLLTAGTSPLTITLSQLDSDSPTVDLLPVTLVVSGSVTAN